MLSWPELVEIECEREHTLARVDDSLSIANTKTCNWVQLDLTLNLFKVNFQFDLIMNLM